jgi:hypothetical protein
LILSSLVRGKCSREQERRIERGHLPVSAQRPAFNRNHSLFGAPPKALAGVSEAEHEAASSSKRDRTSDKRPSQETSPSRSQRESKPGAYIAEEKMVSGAGSPCYSERGKRRTNPSRQRRRSAEQGEQCKKLAPVLVSLGYVCGSKMHQKSN